MASEYPVTTSQLIVTKTDLHGHIVHANDVFCEISGYDKKELIGTDHNLVRHPDMPRIVFRLLWAKLSDCQEVYAFVKNLRKDGRYYWVFANVKPTFNNFGEVDGFISVRKAANKTALPQIQKLYERLSKMETPSGYGECGVLLRELLSAKGIKYNEFVKRLQKGEKII